MKLLLASLMALVLIGCFAMGESQVAQPIAPFLTIPLSKDTPNLKVSQGWEYSDDEKAIHPDIATHFAVDFPAKWGTPVYASADGLAVASYHTYDMVDSQGRTIGYGLGLFVAIWHEKAQLYTSYSHLSGIGPSIPYLAPVKEGNNWQPRAALYVPVNTFKQQARAIKRGELIGYIGYTGLRLSYEETPNNPPTVDPKTQKTWDPHGAHLHWEVYTRTPNGAKKDLRLDPFGIKGKREQYADVFRKASGLILPNSDGSPRFAKD